MLYVVENNNKQNLSADFGEEINPNYATQLICRIPRVYNFISPLHDQTMIETDECFKIETKHVQQGEGMRQQGAQ